MIEHEESTIHHIYSPDGSRPTIAVRRTANDRLIIQQARNRVSLDEDELAAFINALFSLREDLFVEVDEPAAPELGELFKSGGD